VRWEVGCTRKAGWAALPAREAGQAGPVRLGHAGMEKGGGKKERLAGPGSASS
jgi:hypothetical protein